MQLKGETVGSLLADDSIRQPEQVLGPWLRKGEFTLCFAPRGIGKTFFALQVAQSVSSGSPFLKWRPPYLRRVAFFDGEMGRALLKDRFRLLDNGSLSSMCGDGLTLYSRTRQGNEDLNLADPKQHGALLDICKRADVVVFDNLNTLTSPADGRDDDVRMWYRVRALILALKRMGVAVLLIHHAGKAGGQYGTSMRENDADTMIALREGRLRRVWNGTSFEMHLDKTRAFYGEDAEPIHLELRTENERATWSWEDLKTLRRQVIRREVAHLTSRLLAEKYQMSLYEVEEILADSSSSDAQQSAPFQTENDGGWDGLF